jgi:tRNA G10  N-methylase Trm11
MTIKFILKKPITVNTKDLLDTKRLFRLRLDDNHSTLHENSSFRARFFQIEKTSKLQDHDLIERNLGAWILSLYPRMKVDLEHPDQKLYAVSWGAHTAVGWVYGENTYSLISWREPKKSTYFRGGSMKPRLCRLLINLIQPLHPVVMDPFCGHGGILREIADLGSFAVGIEISKKVIRELKENNQFFGYDDRIAIIMGDALVAPLRRNAIMMVATDPPYAIQTTTKGMDRDDLLKTWLISQPKGVKLVFTTPAGMMNELPDGWRMDFDGNDYVHKSLTRRARRVYKEE